MKIEIPLTVNTRVLIEDVDTKETLLDKSNAIHSQNFSRIIARALAHEPNSWIHRIALGNGGTFTDAVSNIVYNPPNDGSNGSWESRLYNETYSEIIDSSSIFFGQDLGSSDPHNIRPGGGANPSDDPSDTGVVSQEAGMKSNVIITMFLNRGEPSGQRMTDMGEDADNDCFIFDEIGLYSPGLPARATHGYTTVSVGDKKSTDFLALNVNGVYTFRLEVDGIPRTCQITVPPSGSGPNGEITYGDFCEGINSGSWISSGDNINDNVYVYITDNTQGTYPSIIGKQSYGNLIFQSTSVGSVSKVTVTCQTNNPSDMMNAITGNVCANCNITTVAGSNAGVQNDPARPENERERLLTHIIFDPILKSGNRAIKITYTLTISIARNSDSEVELIND